MQALMTVQVLSLWQGSQKIALRAKTTTTTASSLKRTASPTDSTVSMLDHVGSR